MFHISYCGLNCEECEAFVATKNNDKILKKKVAKKWSQLYGIEMKPENIHCAGCKSTGKKGKYCESMCKISKCCTEKGIETCAQCDSFACKDLKEIFNYSLDAKKSLECLRPPDKLEDSVKP
jgi:hypothetical protein